MYVNVNVTTNQIRMYESLNEHDLNNALIKEQYIYINKYTSTKRTIF